MPEDIIEKRLLLADDDDDDCLLFSDILDELAMHTTLRCKSNGLDLLTFLSGISRPEELPHFLFLDLNMPLRNGIECLEEIRANKKYAKIRIIIISTSAQAEVVKIAYEKGADLYLRKPDSFKKLKDAVRSILQFDWKNSKHGLRSRSDDFFIESESSDIF